jgi:putative peptidoglycan lipid II flippase
MVRKVFNFMYKEVRGLHQAAYILALFAVGSQILAIIRDRLLAHSFGAGAELDLYYAAFRIPDLLYVLFASVLSVYVLLPFVRRRTEEAGSDAGAAVLSQVFSLFLICFSAIALLLALAAPWYVPYLFPGFADNTELLGTLIQILLLQTFLLGVSSLCGVVTQMSQRFVLYAVSPLLYNLSIIFGIIVLYPHFGLVGLVSGVVIGALGHLLIQIPFVRKSSYSFGIVRTFDWKHIRDILYVAIPRALTLSVNQIVLLLLVGIASTLTVGSVSVFQFGFNLQSVPLAVIGMSYSVAAFPTLTTLLGKNKQQEFNHQLLTALRHIIFWSIPITLLIIVLRAQIVRVLLGSGAFDWGDTRLTAAVLAIFVLSLVAQAVLLLVIRAFYAGGWTFIPLWATTFSSAVVLGGVGFFFYGMTFAQQAIVHNTLASVFRLEGVPGVEVLSLAMAFVVSQMIQVGILLYQAKKVFSLEIYPLSVLVGQALLAGVSGAVTAYGTLLFIVDGINQDTFIGICLQGLVAGMAGLLMAIAVYFVCRAPELSEIYRSFHSRIFKTDIIAPQGDTL